MRFLKTNTATRVTVGPFLDKGDGITPETAITVTSCKLTLMVDDGGTPTLVLDAAPTASGGNNDMVHVTGDDAGFYDLELAAANVNYVGRAMLAITDAAVHCPVFHEFMILPANVYDSLVGGTDTLQADVTQWLGTAAATPTVNGVPEVDITHIGGTAVTAAAGIPEVKVASIAANAITAAATATDFSTEVNTAILAVLGALNDAAADGAVTTTDTMVAYLKQIINTLEGTPGIPTWPAAAAPGNAVSIAEAVRYIYDQIGVAGANATEAGGTGDHLTALATQASVNTIDDLLDTELPALTTEVGKIPKSDGTSSWNATALAAIQGEANDALVAYDPPTNAELTTAQGVITALLPAALTGDGNMKVDVLAISGDTTAADRLEALMDGIIVAQVNDAGASTTSFVADGFTEATNDHFNGRLITFLTGALAGQQAAITDYVGATQTLTVTALTEAPANDDYFIVH